MPQKVKCPKCGSKEVIEMQNSVVEIMIYDDDSYLVCVDCDANFGWDERA